MKFPRLNETLKRGVGRRILGLFLLAGLVPVIFTAAFAYQEMGRALERDVGMTLRQHGKDYGLDVLARLQRISATADHLAEMGDSGGRAALSRNEFFLQDFEAVWIIGDDRSILGDGDKSSLEQQIDHARATANDSGLLVVNNGEAAKFVFIRSLRNERMLAMVPASNRVWGQVENLPYATDVCAITRSGRQMHCSSETALESYRSRSGPNRQVSAAPVEWVHGDETMLAGIWQLFLAAEFGAPSVDIVAMQPAAIAYQSRADFGRVFMPAIGLVVVLIALLSFNLIGQSLKPLRKLTAATRQLAAGNLLARVRITTGDEFEALGDSFNNMAAKLNRQIDALEVMSTIDKMILSGKSFESVSQKVVHQLLQLTGFGAAGIVVKDNDSPNRGRMISSAGGAVEHDRIPLPANPDTDWYRLREIGIDKVDEQTAPFGDRFAGFGMSNVVQIPIILNQEFKGLLLLGSRTQIDMESDRLQRCVDLAGRFAVALSSLEREEALYRQAHFDELTGLPNRQLLKDRLEYHIGMARRDEYAGALLYLDLDRFKEINDVYGHSIGDGLLVQAAERIVRETRDNDTVARLGGDEFVVIMPALDSAVQARMMASSIIKRMSDSFTVNGEDHYVGVSIGVVLFPEDGDSVELLLKNADAAMYRAKEAGRARYEFFSRKLNAESRRKIDLERDLRTAYANDELRAHYQPQIELSTGIISGAEALMRWEHRDYGYVSPAEFIPLAEDSDLIVKIGRWIIRQTCRDLRMILGKGLHPGSVSINVSTRQLRDDKFVDDILSELQRFQIHPGYLQLEVTETALSQNRDTVIDLLTTLRAEGVRVAIDDFGTGYSSLSYLQNLPFDVIKIDKSFVDQLCVDDKADNICRTIIRMAHELGKKAIAEGVETRAQVDFLKANDCNFAQGFYYSKPLPMRDFVAFVEVQDYHTQRRKALEIVK